MQKIRVKVLDRQGNLVGPLEVPRVEKTDAEWRAHLTAEQFQVARAKGTERPFCGNLLDNKQEGVYACICCRLPLFSSDAKFHSGTGWPSFFPTRSHKASSAAQTTRSVRRPPLPRCHL